MQGICSVCYGNEHEYESLSFRCLYYENLKLLHMFNDYTILGMKFKFITKTKFSVAIECLCLIRYVKYMGFMVSLVYI